MSEEFPYQLQEPLGQGGMGLVYRAWEPRASRFVALKVVHDAPDATRLQRFLREGELTARLDHPGIVRVFASGAFRGRPYLAYELVEGGQTLGEAFVGRSLEERLEWVAQAGEALGYAHRQGVVHRDVKPENVLVGADGRAKVADFGLATAADVERLTRTGAVLGTPSYMAPEQVTAAQGEVGPRSDVWALGVILYEAISDELPFRAGSMLALVAGIVGQAPARPSSKSAERVSRDLEWVCLRALEKRPEDRYPDAAAFAADVRRVLRGERVEIPRSRRVGWVLGAGVVAASAAVGFALLQPRPEASEPAAEVEEEVEVVEEVEGGAPEGGVSVAGWRARAGWMRGEGEGHAERERVRRELASWGRAPLAHRALPLDDQVVEPKARVRFWSDEEVLVHAKASGQVWCWGVETGVLTPLWDDFGVPVADLEVVRPRAGRPGSVVVCAGMDVWRAEGHTLGELTPTRLYTYEGQEGLFAGAAVEVPGRGVVACAGAWERVVLVPLGGGAVTGLDFPQTFARDLGVDGSGRWLVAACGIKFDVTSDRRDRMGVWDLSTGERVFDRGHLAAWNEVEVAPDGSSFVVGDNASGALVFPGFDALEDNFILESPDLPKPTFTPYGVTHEGAVRGVAYTPDGAWVLTAKGDPMTEAGSVRLWRTEDWSLVRTIPLTYDVECVDVSPDGAVFALGRYDGAVELWGLYEP